MNDVLGCNAHFVDLGYARLMKEKTLSLSPVNAKYTDDIVCHGCDHRFDEITCLPGHQLNCTYCGSVLKTCHDNWLPRAAACTVAGLVLFVLALSFPFIGLEAVGLELQSRLLSGVLALLDRDQFILASLVFITIFLMPLLELLGLSYLVAARWFDVKPRGLVHVMQMLFIARPWNMMEIFFISVLITTIKLGDIAALVPGVGLYAFAALVLVLIYTHIHLDKHALWQWLQYENRFVTEENEDLTSCHCCDAQVGESLTHCPRCYSKVHRRIPASYQRTLALLIAATVLYLPANLLPIMTTSQFGAESSDTILSGVVHLYEIGSFGIAAVVFVASIVVPVVKIITLSYLLWVINRKGQGNPKHQTRLYRIIEFVGRWSMIDVFVVTLLVALVQFGVLANVEPNGAIVCFAGVVVLTMLAAETFDPRLLWDAHNDK